MLVKCALNSKYITQSITSKAPPHHHTSSSMLHSGNHTCGNHPFTYSGSNKDTAVGTKNLKLDQRTDFHRYNVHCSCFLAQTSLFLLFMSFSSGFFASIWPWRPDSHSLLQTVDVEMWLLLELCEAFIWDAISEAATLTILSFAAEVTLGLPVLWRSSCEPVLS